MTQSLSTEIADLGIPTVTREKLAEKQLHYVSNKLSQGVFLDTLDDIINWLSTPILGLGLAGLVTCIAIFSTAPTVSTILIIAAGILYLIALFFIAFGIYDLAFPQKRAKLEYVLCVITSVAGLLGAFYLVHAGYPTLVWYAALAGVVMTLAFAGVIWARLQYFDSKHFGSAGTGGYEALFTPPEEARKQLKQVQEQVPDVRVNLYKVHNWLGTIGLPIKITKECNLYYYEIYRPKGRKNDVVYLDYFWEA